jgi:hypothetical protein
VGRWEGDTLVIETRDFLPDITFTYGTGKGLPADGTVGTASGAVNAFFGGGPGGGGRGGPPGGGPPGAGAPGAGPAAGGPPAGGPPGAGPPGGGAPGGGGRGGPRAAGLSTSIWGPHGEGMYMVERYRLVNPNSMELKLTIYDDTVWTTPNETTRTFNRIQKGISELGPFSGEPDEWVCSVSITSFDPNTNSYKDKDPEEMVKYLDKLGH